ncbi:hypothetical protein CNMCM7691_004249 [Aspergillus felis]|uniref:Uncharacterized protein n=1 Tax=Aspergillus felis TaxID=1287682 RepID=A0A8H6R4R6_9EURO|nr:hypothetical protein CNMCM7691_004249 [Aspergillus felis]
MPMRTPWCRRRMMRGMAGLSGVEAGPADEAEELGGVEDEADVVEGGGHEAAAADHALFVLVFEGVFDREPAEEGAGGRDEEFQLGLAGGGGAFMLDWLDLRVALMGVGRYGHEVLAVFLVDSGGLRVQHKGDRQETLLDELPPETRKRCTHFDPFNLDYVSLRPERHVGMKGELTSWSRRCDYRGESAKHNLNG